MARDWLKDIGSAFERVGSGVKSAAGEARKAVGIGVGSIELILESADVRAGDTLRGRVVLTLEEPVEAKRLVVKVVGTRKKHSYGRGDRGGTVQRTHTETVYSREVEVGGADSYHRGEHWFALVLPEDATSAAAEITTDGLVGDIARVVSTVAGGRTPVAWKMVAFLDVPWKRNIKASRDISVSPPAR